MSKVIKVNETSVYILVVLMLCVLCHGYVLKGLKTKKKVYYRIYLRSFYRTKVSIKTMVHNELHDCTIFCKEENIVN